MCNHYRNDPERIAGWAEFAGYRIPVEPPSIDADAWPRREALVARTIDGIATLDVMRWGVPQTLPGKRPGSTITMHVTNVRNLESPFWRAMLNDPQRRCLVPFKEFAEPVIGGGRREHWFSTERPVACFAGIWRPHEVGHVFAFLTTAPNPLVAPLHPKAMPVILAAEDERIWLCAPTEEALALVSAYPSQLMHVATPG